MCYITRRPRTSARANTERVVCSKERKFSKMQLESSKISQVKTQRNADGGDVDVEMVREFNI